LDFKLPDFVFDNKTTPSNDNTAKNDSNDVKKSGNIKEIPSKHIEGNEDKKKVTKKTTLKKKIKSINHQRTNKFQIALKMIH